MFYVWIILRCLLSFLGLNSCCQCYRSTGYSEERGCLREAATRDARDDEDCAFKTLGRSIIKCRSALREYAKQLLFSGLAAWCCLIGCLSFFGVCNSHEFKKLSSGRIRLAHLLSLPFPLAVLVLVGSASLIILWSICIHIYIYIHHIYIQLLV